MSKKSAVAVTELGLIWGGHFGSAPSYQIYSYVGELIENRENPNGADKGNTHSHGAEQADVTKELLSDCSIFIGKQMGKASRKRLIDNLGIETILTNEKSPIDAIKIILERGK